MKTITIFNHKGGSGRSTTSLSLYFGFNKAGAKTCIVDTDPQRSITTINSVLDAKINITSKDSKELNNYKIAIVDTPPYYNADTPDLLKRSDIVVVPCKPSALDVIATIQTYNDILKHNTNAYVFFNAIKVGTVYTNLSDQLEKNKVKTFETVIHNRVSFSNCLESTGNIFDMPDIKAQNEITNLINEIYSKII